MPASSNNPPIPHDTVAGLRITTLRRTALRKAVQARVHDHIPTRIVTPYSEFLFRTIRDQAFQSTLNAADIALPDGIALLWAATFLSVPLTAHSRWGAWLQTIGHMVYTGACIVLWPSRMRRIIPETIPGSSFVFDLCEIAVQEQAPIYIAGGFGDTPRRTAEILAQRFPGLVIAGISNASIPSVESDAAVQLAQDIARSGARIAFLALGPQKQELFMMRHWDSMRVDLAIGLGGTFNYITGDSHLPPRWIRGLGLEWLFRLITEPVRAKRIYRATFGLIGLLMQYKVDLWTKARATGTL